MATKIEQLGAATETEPDGGWYAFECQDMSSSRCGDIVLRATNEPPHWSYVAAGRVAEANVRRFLPMPYCEKLFSETPAGYKAAERYISSKTVTFREAPIGTVPLRYTIERIVLAEARYVDDNPGVYNTTRHLELVKHANRSGGHVAFHYGVREWSCIEAREVSAA